MTTPQPAPAGTVTAKLIRYGQRIVQRYDSDDDGRLSEREWAAMRGTPKNADLNGDRQITAEEFARYSANYGAGRRIRLSSRGDAADIVGTQPLAAEPGSQQTTATNPIDDPNAAMADRRRGLKFFAPLPPGVPGWFAQRDRDGDAQLTLAEFSPKLRSTEVAEFKQYDVNGDGLLTAAELTRSATQRPDARAEPELAVPPVNP